MTSNTTRPAQAEIVREYGPFAGTTNIGGVTHDGRRVWAAAGARLLAFDPASGDVTRTLDCAADAGTATFTEMLDRVRCIAGAISVPFIADGDTGYGGLLNVDRTVRGYAAAQIRGDTVARKDCVLQRRFDVVR